MYVLLLDFLTFQCFVASMARKIYLRGGLGVGAFKRIYGGSQRNGSRPPHFCESSGAIARHILQQLQNMNIIDLDPKGLVLVSVFSPIIRTSVIHFFTFFDFEKHCIYLSQRVLCCMGFGYLSLKVFFFFSKSKFAYFGVCFMLSNAILFLALYQWEENHIKWST